ncbi:MAG: hypothetical protein KDB82_05345 [Planctomycetes bacterium]|nr:hypothetical protein [Planctomycetota bacterium]
MTDLNSFGDGSTDYEKYIHTQDIYKLQKTADEWVNEEELLFQSVHQGMEIWLKVVIQHLTQVCAWMNESNYSEATRFLNRSADVLQWLGEGLKFPESIAPWDYHKIRMGLGKGSGQQSPTYQKLHEVAPDVLDAFEATLKREGKTLDDIQQDPHAHDQLYALTKSMLRFDQHLMHWKYRHFQLVKRIIGDAVMSLKGVPASALEKTTHEPAFPDLWAVINRTTNTYNAKHRPEGGGAYQ